MEIKAVTFDLEGTLIDLEDIHLAGWEHAARCAGLNITASELASVPGALGGGALKVASIIHSLGGNSLTIEQIIALELSYYKRSLTRTEIALRPGVVDLLSALNENKISCAIGSLTAKEQAVHLIEQSGLLDFIPREHIVLKEDVHRLKPAPDVFLETARRLGVVAPQQLVFEDSATGIRAACAAGSIAIAMPVINTKSNVSALRKAGAMSIYDCWTKVELSHYLECSQAA
ncbi:MAG: HAD family phosphatase [Bdellovibrionales bacterium]|nr:HAD family phosphatase [Bdellovibrionales bacterium]